MTFLTGLSLSSLGIVAAAMSQRRPAEAVDLQPGDAAPDAVFAGSDGQTYRLADYRGKRAVVLAWFPKAFTPGCTVECRTLREQGDALRAFEVAYFTASCDSVETNKRFAASLELDYPILCDPEGAIGRQFGVVAPDAKTAKRWTYIIGKDGKVLFVDKDVKPAGHAAALAAKLKELGVPARQPFTGQAP